MGLWAGVTLLLLTLMPGRVRLDITGVILPLALAAGAAGERFVRDVQARTRESWLVALQTEGLDIPMVVILWVHLYLVLARYARFGSVSDLALALMTIALQALLAVIFALAIRPDAALRAVGVGTAIVLGAATFAAGWGAVYERPTDPRELLSEQPTALEVRDLIQTLRDLSWRRTGLPMTIAFTVETEPDSVLGWYTRDFNGAQIVDDGLQAAHLQPAILITERRELALPSGAEETTYVGQDFAQRRTWDPATVGCTWGWPPQCQNLVRWLIFRDASPPPSPEQITEWAVLWIEK
jgi:hypothetical protein